MRKPIDRETWRHWQRIQTHARKDGRHLAEALNDAGMLLTRRQRRAIKVAVLRDVAARLGQMNPSLFIRAFYGADTATGLDMQRATVQWLDRLAAEEERREP